MARIKYKDIKFRAEALNRIETATFIDQDIYDARVQREEEEERTVLTTTADRWVDVVQYLTDEGDV